MRAGADPAIGKGEPVQVAAATPAPRKVLIRRVIVTRIVEHRRAATTAAPRPPRPRRRERRQLRARAVRRRAPAARRAGSRARAAPDDHPVLMTDHTFDCMGTHARIVCADDATRASCRAFLERFDAALSRFRPDSELCRLNAARGARGAGLAAAAHRDRRPACGRPSCTGGLVDPTLTGALEAAGYDRDRREPELALADALAAAPRRRAARPRPCRAAWRHAAVLERDASAARPGVRLDTGGTGKGLAADLLAVRFAAQRALGDRLRRRPAGPRTASRSRSTSAIRSPASPSTGCA